MEKDWFNGKIKAEYIDWIKYTLIAAPICFFMLGSITLGISIFLNSNTLHFDVYFWILTILLYLLTLVYSLIPIKIIRSYPKHKIIAHILIRKFVFDDEELLLDDLQDIILEYIYSKEIKQILKDNADSLSLQQWATLATNFIKGNKYLLFKELSYFAKSKYEKKLFKVALKDVKRFNDIEDKSTKFYQRKDQCEMKPYYPFDEEINLEIPFLFDYGDIVTYKDDLNTYYLVYRKPIKENNGEFDEYAYLCYNVNDKIKSKDDLFKSHAHLSAYSINKIKRNKLPNSILSNIDCAIEIINKEGDNLLK